MTKNLSVKIKVNKLSHNPLFIKFLNWEGDKHNITLILDSLYNSFETEEDKKIIKEQILDDTFLSNLEKFKNKFSIYLLNSISNNSVSEEFLAWLSNSFKYIKEDIEYYHNNETRKIHIKDPTGRWLESVVCYNFIMTFNNFGIEVIKRCPVCSKFFSHKGKYAKYCDEVCKSKGMKKVC